MCTQIVVHRVKIIAFIIFQLPILIVDLTFVRDVLCVHYIRNEFEI